MATKNWFITGVSAGLGLEIAKVVLAAGHSVAGTLRKPEQIAAFEALAPGRAHGFLMDVAVPEQISTTTPQVIEKLGHVDVVVNNAGFGLIGALEEVTDEQIRYQLEVNVFGAINVMRAFLPHLRQRRSGFIINLSSIAGVSANPAVGLYNTTKFALEGISEALSKETAGLGIKVAIIEPGPFRTEFLGRSLHIGNPIDDYKESTGAIRQRLEMSDGKQAGDPVKAAEAILKLTEMENPPLRLAMGNSAVDIIRNKLQSQLAELAQHEAWARSMDFE